MKSNKGAERLRRTQRIIKRRWRTLMSWSLNLGAETREEAQSRQVLTPHHLHKYNLNCGCGMCRAVKKAGKYNRAKQKKNFHQLKKEIE